MIAGMRAIVVREFGGPEVMTLEEVPDPTPGPGQVLLRIGAAGVNPVDHYIRTGTYARKPPLPYTPGMDAAGTVQAVGEGVTQASAGDRVYAHGISGAYAELVTCDASQVVRLPASVSFAQGAAIGVPYGTAWRALLLRANARPGETVLVHGASGGVGTAAVQIARAHGMRVIGTAGTDAGLQAVRQAGASEALNHRLPDYLAQIPEITGGRGVNVVLEMLANVNLDRDLDVLAFRGRIVVIGNRGRVELDPRKIMGKDGAVLGMTLFNTPPEELQEIHAGLAAGLEAGTLRPLVGRELPLADAADAHRLVMEPGALGKIVLVP
jgi:NADPH2:quinone reductase